MNNIILNFLWPVYNNVIGMLKDRKHIVEGEKIDKKSKFKELFRNKKIWIKSIMPDGNSICMTYISKHTRSFTAEIYKNALKSINTKKIDYIIMVVDSTNKTKKSDLKIHIEFIHRKRFYLRLTKHVLTNKHRIMSKKEEIEFFENATFTKEELPKIKIDDPFSIHYGAKINDIFEIERQSKHAIILDKYYRVVCT